METAGCYKCSSREASPVGFTWWGGVLGPKLLSHVRCAKCGAEYNAKTGQPNTAAIVVYVAVVIAVLTAILIAVRT
jgi:hypothetical protein